MSPFFIVFTFLNAWWIMLFIAIPFGTNYEENKNDKNSKEVYAAAPSSINWKKVIIIATVLAAIVTFSLKVIISRIITTGSV